MTETDAIPRPEFLKLGQLYKLELEPWLQSQDGRRRKARLLRWIIIGPGLAAAAALFIAVLTLGWAEFWIFVAFVLAIGSLVIGNIPLSRVSSDVKSFVMEKLAGCFGFAYEAKPAFGHFGLFEDLFLLPNHNDAKFEDGLAGTVADVPFEMVEAHLTERRKSGKNTRNVTVFRGLLLSLPHPPIGDDAVSVWRRNLEQWTEGEGWQQVKLDDPAFDEVYSIHSDSADTARRLLPRDLRDSLSKIEEDHGDIRLGIIDDRIVIAIERGADSFEAGKMNRPLADPNRVQDMAELFAIPFDAIEGFKLQPRKAGADAG